MTIDDEIAKVRAQNSLTIALRRLGQLAHTNSWRYTASSNLTPTQQKILDVLQRRSQGLSISRLARELGISTATTSDCVKTLQSKQLLRKLPSQIDARQVTVTLTNKGTAAAAAVASLPDPFDAGLASLAQAEQTQLIRSLIKMIRSLEQANQLAPSRTCLRCKLFDPAVQVQSRAPHFCRAHQIYLADLDIRMDCVAFEGGDAQLQERLWRQFEGGHDATGSYSMSL